MLIKCGHTGCKSLFESPRSMPRGKAWAIVRQQGWVRRGSIQGFFNFCPDHNPDRGQA